MSDVSITSELKLPCGAVLKNRLCKAAMTERLAGPDGAANDRHVRLYDRWAKGGSGLLLTGNVQIDHRHLEAPGNVIIDGEQSPDQLAALEAYARAGTQNGTHLWMQISHAGRQTPRTINETPAGPSDIRLEMPGNLFGTPRPMTEDEILDVIARFAHVAGVARQTGFTGVQIHGAHGYLVSEFLSPDINTRTDRWGGPLENRARLLLEIVGAVRAAVGPDFPVAVKMNSADFQKGGFAEGDAVTVAGWLADAGLDLLEISGGTYERPALIGADEITLNPDRLEARRESTIAREAYFLDYAGKIREAVKDRDMVLLVTGGFRTRAGMDAALSSGGCDVVGLGRPLCAVPDGPNGLLDGSLAALPQFEKTLKFGPLRHDAKIKLFMLLNQALQQNWYYRQIGVMGDGFAPDATGGKPFSSMVKQMRIEAAAAKAHKAHWG
ncbi:MAG: NADH:flavin oxidoreductase/NADH oxidase family protein [Parvibaculales bacterium]